MSATWDTTCGDTLGVNGGEVHIMIHVTMLNMTSQTKLNDRSANERGAWPRPQFLGAPPGGRMEVVLTSELLNVRDNLTGT